MFANEADFVFGCVSVMDDDGRVVDGFGEIYNASATSGKRLQLFERSISITSSLCPVRVRDAFYYVGGHQRVRIEFSYPDGKRVRVWCKVAGLEQILYGPTANHPSAALEAYAFKLSVASEPEVIPSPIASEPGAKLFIVSIAYVGVDSRVSFIVEPAVADTPQEAFDIVSDRHPGGYQTGQVLAVEKSVDGYAIHLEKALEGNSR